MNLLAFDTGTDMMSIAVARTVQGQVQQWQHTSTGGAQASGNLIPAILDLMQQAGLDLAELDAICFGAGPGSFTGLRTACSVAQGLAFGAAVPVLAVDSLLALAEEARHSTLPQAQAVHVTALLDARMDEVYAASYAYAGGQWQVLQDSGLLRPEQVAAHLQALAVTPAPWLLAGNALAVYGERITVPQRVGSALTPVAALPTASAMLRLAPALLAAGQAVDAAHALPRYIRDKVAKTTLERAAEKAAALGTATH